MAGLGLTLFLLTFGFLLINSTSLNEEISIGKFLKRDINDRDDTTCIPHQEHLLSVQEKNYLLLLHSNIRENITKSGNKLPVAFYIKKLSWNETLAKAAQIWTNKCDEQRNSRPKIGNQKLGQLVAVANVKEIKNVRDLFLQWAEGLWHLTPEIIAKYRKPKPEEFDYGPAAQLIWWNTSQMGCGRSIYQKCEGGKNCTTETFVELVCNYLAPGNNEGDPVFISEKDNNLICQFDDQHVNCKKKNEPFVREKKPLSRIEKLKRKFLEIWPLSSKGISLKADWNYFWLLNLPLLHCILLKVSY